MATESKVVFKTIRDKTKLINVGNEQIALALAIRGATQSKLLAPVDKGQLRNSIQWITGTGGLGGGVSSEALSVRLRRWEAAVGATADYAVYVEYGTRFQSPQVYMRSSLALLAGIAAKVVKEKMDAEFALGPLKYGEERIQF